MSDQTTDPTWITESDLAVLIAIADMAQEFVVNWGILATAVADADAEQAGERLDEIADELLPLLRQYSERFPQTPADQPIPYTVTDDYDWTNPNDKHAQALPAADTADSLGAEWAPLPPALLIKIAAHVLAREYVAWASQRQNQ